MTSSCNLGFQATQLVSHRLGLTLFSPVVGESPGESQSISESNNRIVTTDSARFDKWLEVLAVEDLTPKERRPELQREQRRRRGVQI